MYHAHCTVSKRKINKISAFQDSVVDISLRKCSKLCVKTGLGVLALQNGQQLQDKNGQQLQEKNGQQLQDKNGQQLKDKKQTAITG